MSNGCVIVIGGGGGVGSALVERLDPTRRAIVVASRSASNHGVSGVHSVVCDATDFEAVDGLVQQALSDHGEVDGVVNLAGSILLKPAHLVTPADWSATIATNLTTAFAVVRAVGKNVRTPASVVLASTVAAATGLPNHEAIAAAKAGVEGLTRSAAATYAGRGLRFNAVAPGLVDTPLAERITRSEAALEHSRKMHPLGRIGTPADIAAAIDFLLSEESSWMTGQIIGIDGGLGATRAAAT